MKNVLIVLLFVAGYANAQRMDAAKVPAAVKATFSKQFPKVATAKWEKEDGNYEANFKNQGHNMSATFDAKGALLETETAIKITELPAGVVTYVKTHLKGAPIKDASKIVKANGEVNFEAEVNGMDELFDSKGNFIKESKD